jgi:hypothetical protein
MRRYKPWRPQPTTDARPPAVRLEAFLREENEDRAGRMFDRIADDAEARADRAEAWITAARELADRLIISENAFCYFAQVFSEAMLVPLGATDPELVRLHAEIRAVEAASGLAEYESYGRIEPPPDWHRLNDEWYRRADELIGAALLRRGFRELSELWEKSRDEFDARATEGRAEVWGTEDDDVDEDSLDDGAFES